MKDNELPPLPSGVKYLGDPESPPAVETTEVDDQPVQIIHASYRVHGYLVELSWMVGHPMGGFSGPNKMEIDFESFSYGTAEGDEINEFSKVFEGVTSSVLRSVPIRHAQALMRGLHERLSLQDVEQRITPLPSRVESEKDYVHISAAYVDLVKSHSVQPIQRLSEWTGESVDTWFARLRRARTRGILVGKGHEASIAPKYWPVVDEIRASLREAREAANGN
ncbi:hypothetical protein ACIQF8_01525 [Pseudarthrobacter sp. NPDC092184]|uniref:hypothetical protein n=1 Tax=unclassified Pseudarthrobacter TaxID=2647000 RepID=UPI00381D30FD